MNGRRDLSHDLILPTLLFAALGGMTWAIRGCSGFGGENGCIFAGVTWGAAWWFIAREPGSNQTRRYSSGWIILALTLGIGLSGARGWMQWPHFFNEQLYTNYLQGKFVPISRNYGFVWLFIAGVPWAGIGACLLAWCALGARASSAAKGPPGTLALQGWALRLVCAFGAAYLARSLFNHLPEVFLPFYNTLKEQYLDAVTNPNLRRLINDNRAAITHLGFYLGCLGFEAVRRDWKNVLLISTVGLVNGLGWALCQNWQWATRVWPGVGFNFWRCWESCGGISIGLAYGLAYYLVNRPATVLSFEFRVSSSPAGGSGEKGEAMPTPGQPHISPSGMPAPAENSKLETRNPKLSLEWLAAHFGLVLGLGLSVKNGLKGWANIYLGNENYWNGVYWKIIGPLMLATFAALVIWRLRRPIPADFKGDLLPHAHGLIWLVLITQNLIAQLVTGPRSVWSEMVFSLYYLLLFLITAVIVYHYQDRERHHPSPA